MEGSETLHPKIYAGILARPERDQKILNELNIPSIGLVVVNLYPFQETIEKGNCSLEEAIEKIDIGGPTLLRAAAKNYHFTTVITDSNDYSKVLNELNNKRITSLQTRFYLAQKVFAHVSNYDLAISNFFSTRNQDENQLFPNTLTLQIQKKCNLRYGENPHQQAAFYLIGPESGANIGSAQQHVGKPLSYNNILDADVALECVRQFQEPACVIVKHANPCAVSLSSSPEEAYKNAYKMDPTSSFGGVIAFNTKLDVNTLQSILDNQFIEVLIVPEASQEALTIAKQKPDVRILTVGSFDKTSNESWDFKSVSGGILIQEKDTAFPFALEVASKRAPTEEERIDLIFAWQVIRFIKSNAIVYAKDRTTLGIGAGQMSRVFSAKIAALKAQEASVSLNKAVMASDAFFPFRDAVDIAASRGICAVIQPGGSIRDTEIIKAADEHNIAMIFTHRRHFRH